MKKYGILAVTILLASFFMSRGDNLLMKEKSLKFIYRLYEDDKFDMAVRQIREFYNTYPDASEIPRLRYLEVESNFMKGDYQISLELAQKYQALCQNCGFLIQYQYREGLSWFYLGKYARAVQVLNKVVETENSNELKNESLYWLAVSYYQQRQEDRAKKYFKKYMDNNEGSYLDYAAYTLAKIYQNSGSVSQSNKEAEGLIKRSPQSPLAAQAHVLIMENDYQLKKYDKVINRGNSINSEKVNNYDYVLYLKGVSFVAKKEYSAALIEFNELLKKHPRSDYVDDVYSSTMHVYYLAEMDQKSMALASKLEKAKKGLPVDFLYWFLMSAVRLGKDDLVMLRLPSLDEKDREKADEIYYQWGSAYFEKKQYEKTVDLLKNRKMKNQKIAAMSRKIIADSRFYLGEYNKAAESYDYYIHNGKNAEQKKEALFFSGLSRFKMGKYGEAYEKFDKFRQLYPKDPNYYGNSIVYSLRSLINQELYHDMVAFSKKIEVLPGKTEDLFYYYYYTAYAHYQTHELGKAIELLNQAAEYATDDKQKFTIMKMSGDCNFSKKDYQEALSAYNEAIQYNSEKEAEAIYFQMGLTYIKLKSYGEARESFSKIYELYQGENADEAYYYTGRCFFLEEKYKKVIDHFIGFQNRFPQSSKEASVQFTIADSYYNLGNYEKAKLYYQKVLVTAEEQELIQQALNGLEWSFSRHDDFEKAEKEIDDLYRNSTDPYLKQSVGLVKAHILIKAHKEMEAGRLYDSLLMIRDVKPFIIKDYVNYLINKGEKDKARSVFSKYIDKIEDPSASDYLRVQLAELFFESKEYSKINEIIGLISQDSEYYYESLLLDARLKAVLGQKAQAESLLVTIQKRSVNDFIKKQAALEQGKLYIQTKEYNRAEQLFFEIIASSSGEEAAAAQYYLGEIRFQRNDFDSASSQFLKVKYVYEKFSDWVEKAVYKAALCDIKLDHFMKAKEKLIHLTETARDTTIKNLAKEELERLD